MSRSSSSLESTEMSSSDLTSTEITRTEISVTMKRVYSASIWFCTFSFGLAYNFLSPALVELKNKYNTDIAEISKVFTVILLAYLCGALICGLLYDFLNRQILIVIILYIMATGVVVIPYCPTMTSFFLVCGFIGFASGGFDTGQVVWILEMWQGEAGVYVQSQYFWFALGTLIAPILLRPFLLEEDESTYNGTSTISPSPEDYRIFSLNIDSTVLPTEGYNTTEKSHLYVPLSIGGGIIYTAASVLLLLFFIDRYDPPLRLSSSSTTPSTKQCSSGSFDRQTQSRGSVFRGDARTNHLAVSGLSISNNNGNSVEVENINEKKRRWDKIILIALSATVLGCYQGMEICTFSFLPTFTHYIDLRMPEKVGAEVLSVLTGAFTFGRFMGIFIVIFLKIRPALILLVNLSLILIANFLFLFFANTHEALVWVCAAVLGLGYSTVFACIYDHIEKHLEITNKVAATMVIAGGLVSALYPLLVGDMVQHKPTVLMFTIFFSVFMCTTSFSCIYWITVVQKRRKENSSSNTPVL